MRKLLLLFVLLSVTFASNAERVRSSVAKNVAKTMLPNAELVDISSESNFNNVYIFSSDNGFVIVSADDRAFPVIAYSDKNPFKVKDMSENVYSWLKSVDKGIQNIADSKGVASEAVKAEWKSFAKGNKPAEKYRSTVAPLITTTWGQDYPYNDSCPMVNEDRTVVGCVATAMAQIMNYWEWPHRGEGSRSYQLPRPIGKVSANFGETVYDWDNMVDEFWIYKAEDSTWTYESLWSEEEIDAVATLMFHCGVSVSMDYGVDESGAYSEDVAPALKNYFNYDPNLQLVYKYNYTDTEWKDLLKSELNAGRPVYYAGNTAGLMGHAFVCDGYDANGYFHFNWGWDGYCDGYYLIGDLEPGIGGTGAGNGSYNDNNNIIIGIQPNPATPRISAPANLSAEVDFPNVTITWSEVAEAVSYKLYRNGKLIASVTENTYTDLAPGQNTYYVRSVSEDGVNSVNSEKLDVEVLFKGPEITDLTAKRYNVNNVKLNWTSDVVENATLKYYDGDYQGWYTGMSPSMYWGHRFTKEELAAKYAGMSITSVDVIVLEDEQYELLIYSEEDDVLEKVYSQEFTCPSSFYEKWFTVTLDTPILLDYTKNILIMLSCPSGPEYGVSVPVAVDESVNFDKNARIMYDEVYFYELANTDTWFIKTNLTNQNTYDVYRNGVEIASEIKENSYNDTNLELGTYEYSVVTNYSGGVTDPKTVVIELGEPEEYTLTLSVDSEEKGSVEGDGKYLESTTVTAKATPKYGYELKDWTENGTQVSTDLSYTFEIEGNRDLVANFVENNLSIEVVGTTGPTYMGASDGKIEVKAKSGTAPYIYELGSDKSEPINTSYTFENLADGNYTVKVTDATGFSVTEIVVLDGSGELSPPTNVKAVANGTRITLSWDPVIGAEAYFIYYGWEVVGAAFSKTNFELTNLTPEKTYCYTVIALAEFDDEGYPTKYSDFSEEACATTEDGSGEVLPPSNVKAVANGTTITLSWDAVDGALAYGIYRGDEWLGGTYGTSVEFKDLTPGATYCFTVVSITEIDAEGYITGMTDKSEEACATIEGEAVEVLPPTNVKAVANGTTITLSWDAADGALAYGIFSNGEFLGGAYNTSVTFKDLTPGTTYCYTVVSITGIDADGYITGMTDESEEACATIKPDAVEELTSLFNIYPNPVNDKLYIETEVEIEEVTVYDAFGRLQVTETPRRQDIVEFDVSNLNAGVYIVMIKTDDGIVTKRFVKK
ncbi:MAG: C10 family peptidase [Bacteroidales bacterium]|nr:C10 family peptidase [Bacteroidales bacterium]